MLGKAVMTLSAALWTLGVPNAAHAGPWGSPSGRTSAPPWSAPRPAAPAIESAGLPVLTGSMELAEHIHAHLDVLVNGSPVKVPADIGIAHDRHGVSPLHTHDDSGLLHIESPTARDFYLGQFFNEWQVFFSGHNLGGLRTGPENVLNVYVGGRLYPGDPRALKLHAHDEIAVVYGRAGSIVDIPDHYRFPQGT